MADVLLYPVSDNNNSLRLPDEDEGEVFATVTEMLGANRVRVQCADGEERTARIPGRMRKRVWISKDDLVIVEPWEWQDEKADVEYRYDNKEANQIREDDDIDL